jgi:hypothetical protein
MKNLLIVLSVLALSVSAMAYPGPDSIGIYTDGNSDSFTAADLTMSTTTPFESVTLYLCITNPSANGVSGWEAILEVEGPIVAPTYTLTAGLNVVAAPEFQVGIGLGSNALTPNENGSVILAEITGFVSAPTDVVKFYIKPANVSFIDTAGYAGPNDETNLVSVFPSTGGSNTPVFCINEDCFLVGNDDQTFSGVKNMFR